MIARQFILILLTLFIGLQEGISQKSRITLEDLNNLTSISNPQLSADEKYGLFILTRINLAENRRQTELFWIEIKSGEQHSLGEHKGMSFPKWAGEELVSFIANSEDGRQIFTLPLTGNEPTQLTKAENGIQRYAWSPDGKTIAYITSNPVSIPANNYNNAVVLGNNDYLMTEPPTPKSIWLFNLGTGEARQISPEGETVGTGLATSGLVWSPDSKKLAFVIYPSAYSGDSDLGRMHLADIESGEVKPVTTNSGMESPMSFSQDGNKLYYNYKRGGIPANMSDVHVIDLTSQKIENISKSLDRTIYGLEILSDNKMYVMGLDADRFSIWERKRQDEFKAIDLGDLVNLSSMSVGDKGGMLFTASSKYEPNQLFYRPGMNSPSKKLMEINTFLKEKSLGKQEVLTWKSSDELTVNGILTYPPDFDENKSYPLILYIHGGPTASSRLGFNGSAQLMAAQGWIVFQPNYRGSNNLGNKFQSAIANDPSEGPGQDVMSGVKILQEKPYIDKEKIAVSGWSYGGWMTSWLIGRYPDTWVAAVAGAAPVDFTDMYSLNDLNRMRRHSITESPYKGDNLQWAYDNSPITNFSKIKTPTLIMSKIGDYRVTITGSYKLYGALRDNEVPVEFIGYPGRGHFPSDPVRSNDVWQRWIGWLDKYVDGVMEETLPTR